MARMPSVTTRLMRLVDTGFHVVPTGVKAVAAEKSGDAVSVCGQGAWHEAARPRGHRRSPQRNDRVQGAEDGGVSVCAAQARRPHDLARDLRGVLNRSRNDGFAASSDARNARKSWLERPVNAGQTTSVWG